MFSRLLALYLGQVLDLGISLLIDKLDRVLLLLMCVMPALGLVMLYSAAGGGVVPWWCKQVALFVCFIPVALSLSASRYSTVYNSAYPVYIAVLALLFVTEIAGYTSMGATRWIKIFGFKFQPSEIAKIAIVLALARYLADRSVEEVSNWSNLLVASLIVLFPAVLVMKQPDLGTALLILFTSASMFFVAGVNMRRICTASVSLLLLLPVFWFLLHDYQRRRILTFIAGGSDPLGADYNILQSQIAIGSGGLFGKGFLQGTQTHLHFLPEYRTDFIFALIGEEFGFIGCCVVVVLFLMLVGCIFQVSIKCKNVFLKLYCHGIAVSIFLQAFINIAMVMGALPVVGVPLPMVSYGGTTLLSTMFSIALVLTAYNNRKRAPT